MVWVLIVAMAVVTYANRVVFLLQAIRTTPSERVNIFLSYSSYAVLTAIWAPIVFQFNPMLGSASSLLSGFSIAGGDYVSAATVAALLTLCRVPTFLVVLSSIGLFAYLRFLL